MEPAEPKVSFSQEIQPILDAYCIRCHVIGGFANRSGIPHRFTAEYAYDEIVNNPSLQLSDYNLVVPGDPDSSLLYLKISQENPPVGLRMPWDMDRGGPAPTEDEIELIRQWIEDGAPNN